MWQLSVKKRQYSSAGKAMATVFKDSKGKIFIDNFENDQIINGTYYDAPLDKVKIVNSNTSNQTAIPL